MKNGQDKLFKICSQLLKIDNRPVKEVARESGLCLSTVYRLRKGKSGYMRSSTVMQIADAMHKTITVR